MFGNTARASWGTSEWGEAIPTLGSIYSLSAVVSADDERTYGLEAIVGAPDQDKVFSLVGVTAKDADAAFALSYSSARVPITVYGAKDAAPYLLVLIELPTGDVRVSSACRQALGAVWEPRLVNAGKILRTIGRGTDTLKLDLDDTDTRGPRFRDLFALDDPEGSVIRVWLGAEGIPESQHVLVFEGKLSAVRGFSYTRVSIQVVRREAVEDVLLGELVDEAVYTNAPPDSVGRTLPVVFGAVDAHEGVVVNTNEIGTLRYNTFVSDTTISLIDAILFPVAGTVRIDSEDMTYTGKVGNDLTGVTRGVNGTAAQDHPKQSEVIELGVFEVKLASHSLGVIERVKLELPNGNLGDPVPQPVIDYAQGLLTWDEIPQIRDPDARPLYQRIGFNEPDPFFNAALTPQFAARENPGYDAFSVAQVPAGFFLLSLLTNATNVGEPGDIQRAWLAVIFDPDSVPTFGAATTAGKTFTMLPFDTVPIEVARNDEKTGDRIWDVPTPIIGVTAPAPVPFSATPQDVVDPGIFQTIVRAGLLVDKDDSSFACYSFVGLGEALIAGGGNVVYKWTQSEWEGAFPVGSSPIFMEIRALMGSTIVPLSSPWEIYMTLDGVEIPGTRFKCQTANPAGGLTGFIQGVEEFKHTVTGAFDVGAAAIPDPGGGADLNIWDRIELVAQPVTGVSTGFWCGDEISLQGENIPPVPAVSATQDVRRSVTNYFEVTDLIPTKDGSLAWDAFSDVDLLGRASIRGNGLVTALIIETYWLVEFTPFSEATSQTPRTFADVVGLVPDGNPVDVAKAVVTGLPPLGMGLPVERIDQSSYLEARASVVADGLRTDFAVRKQRGALSLLSDLAEQSDSLDTWEDGKHRILRRPLADTSLPTFLTLQTTDLFTKRQLAIGRSPLSRVINKLNLQWRPYAPSEETSGARELIDAASEAKFGRQEAILILDLVQAEATAILVATRKLERVRVPRWEVMFDIPMHGIQLRAGDLVALDSRDFSFEVGEVRQINLDTRSLKKINVQIAVWKK